MGKIDNAMWRCWVVMLLDPEVKEELCCVGDLALRAAPCRVWMDAAIELRCLV